MWALRGESLPILLGVIFSYLLIFEFARESATESWRSAIAFTVFLLLLIGEAHLERRDNNKDEKALKDKKAVEDE